MIRIDDVAGRAFEESALVRAIERAVAALRSWTASSVVVATVGKWLPGVRSRLGHVLLAATLTHLALMMTIARPQSWHWIILPSMVLMAGVVLIATAPPGQRQQ